MMKAALKLIFSLGILLAGLGQLSGADCSFTILMDSENRSYQFELQADEQNAPLPLPIWSVNGEEKAEVDKLFYVFLTAGSYEVCANIPQGFQCSEAESNCVTLQIDENWDESAGENQNLNFFFHSGNSFSFDGDAQDVSLVWLVDPDFQNLVFEGHVLSVPFWDDCNNLKVNLIITYYSSLIDEFTSTSYEFTSPANCKCESNYTILTAPLYSLIAPAFESENYSSLIYDSSGNESSYPFSNNSYGEMLLCPGEYQVCMFIEEELSCEYFDCTKITIPDFNLQISEEDDLLFIDLEDFNSMQVLEIAENVEFEWFLNGEQLFSIAETVELYNSDTEVMQTICLNYAIDQCSNEICLDFQYNCRPELYLNTIDGVHNFTHSQDWEGYYNWVVDGNYVGSEEVLQLPVDPENGSAEICIVYQAEAEVNAYACSSWECYYLNDCDLFSIGIVENYDNNYIYFYSATSQSTVSFSFDDVEGGPYEMSFGSYRYPVDPGFYEVCATFQDSLGVSPSCEVEICEELVIYGNCFGWLNFDISIDGSNARIEVSPDFDGQVEYVFQWFVDGQELEETENVLNYDFPNPVGNQEVCVVYSQYDCLEMQCADVIFPCPPPCGEIQLIESITGNSVHLEVDFGDLDCPHEDWVNWWINEQYLGTGLDIDYVFPVLGSYEVRVEYFTEFDCRYDYFATVAYNGEESCFRDFEYERCGAQLSFAIEGEDQDQYNITWTLNGSELSENDWEVSTVIGNGPQELCLTIETNTCYFIECVLIEEPVNDCDLYILVDKSNIEHVFSLHSESDPDFDGEVFWVLNDETLGFGNVIEHLMQEGGSNMICVTFTDEIEECVETCLCEFFITDLGCNFTLNHEQFWGLNTFEVVGPPGIDVFWTVNGEGAGVGPYFEISFQEIGEYEVCAETECSQYEKCETISVADFLDCDFAISAYQESDFVMHFSANSNTFPFEAGFSSWTINGELEGWGYQFTHEFEEFGAYEICFNYEGIAACDFQECIGYTLEEFQEPDDCSLYVFVDQLGLGVDLSFISSGNLIVTNWTLNGAPLASSQTSYTESEPGLYQACLQTENAAGCIAESCVTFQVYAPIDYCDLEIFYEGDSLSYMIWAEVSGSLGDQEFVWLNGLFEVIGNTDTIEYNFSQTGTQTICVEYYDENPLCASSLHCQDIFIEYECQYELESTLTGNFAEFEVIETVEGSIESITWSFQQEVISHADSIYFNFEEDESYTITLEVQGFNGCYSVEEFVFDQTPCQFEIIWEENGNQHEFYLLQENSQQLLQTEWSLDGISVSYEESIELNIADLGTYEICIELETVTTCQSNQCIEIEIVDQVLDGICPTSPSVMVEDDGTVYLNANYLPTNDLQVYWDFGSGEILNGETHVLTGLEPGNYSFCFVYFSPNCNNTKCVDTVIDDPLCLFEIVFDNDLLEGSMEADGYAADNFQIEWMIEDQIWEGPILEYVFEDFGQWLVCVTASDEEGSECQKCQFLLVEDPSGNNCAVYFDVLLDENTLLVGAHPLGVLAQDLEYNWDFGDGSTAVGQNANHSYNEPGEYEVCVELQTESAECTDIACGTIVVESLVFDLSGNVTTGDLEDDDLIEAIVWLYEYDQEFDSYTVIDTSHTVAAQFQFSELNKEGEYILRAVLKNSSPLTQNHAATYFDEAVYWENAQHIDFNTPEVTLQLKNLQPIPGDGFIEGQIINQLLGEAIEGALVFLTDGNGNVIEYVYTDEFGYFSFDNLVEGSYFVFADVLNVESDFVLVKIKPENLSNHFVDLIFTGERIEGTTASSVDEFDYSSIKISPNPFGDYLTIQWPEDLKDVDLLEFYDYSGILIHQHKIDQSLTTVRLETLNWSSGIYFMRVAARGESYDGQKLVKY